MRAASRQRRRLFAGVELAPDVHPAADARDGVFPVRLRVALVAVEVLLAFEASQERSGGGFVAQGRVFEPNCGGGSFWSTHALYVALRGRVLARALEHLHGRLIGVDRRLRKDEFFDFKRKFANGVRPADDPASHARPGDVDLGLPELLF